MSRQLTMPASHAHLLWLAQHAATNGPGHLKVPTTYSMWQESHEQTRRVYGRRAKRSESCSSTVVLPLPDAAHEAKGAAHDDAKDDDEDETTFFIFLCTTTSECSPCS